MATKLAIPDKKPRRKKATAQPQALREPDLIHLPDTHVGKQRAAIHFALVNAIREETHRVSALIAESLESRQTRPISYERVVHFVLPKSDEKEVQSISYKLLFNAADGLVIYRFTPEATWQVTSLSEIIQIPAPTRPFPTPAIDKAPTETSPIASVAERYTPYAEPISSEIDQTTPEIPQLEHAEPLDTLPAGPMPAQAIPIPAPATQHKKLTVRSKPSDHTRYNARYDDEVLPAFSFGGQYLKNFGFAVGQQVTAHLEPNKITLTIDHPGQDAKQIAREKKIKESRRAMRNIYRKLLGEMTETD